MHRVSQENEVETLFCCGGGSSRVPSKRIITQTLTIDVREYQRQVRG